MIKLLEKEQLKLLDATADVAGMNTSVLMERAGCELASELEKDFSKDRAIVFVCGMGNNGGDGAVAARHLANKGFQVTVLAVGSPKSADARANRKLIEHMSVPVIEWEKGFSFSPYDVIVDCIIGFGCTGELEGMVKDVVETINGVSKEKIIYACDVPTGVLANSDKVPAVIIHAKKTITFAAPKIAFAYKGVRDVCGEIILFGIGIPLFIYKHIGLKKEECFVEGRMEFTYEG